MEGQMESANEVNVRRRRKNMSTIIYDKFAATTTTTSRSTASPPTPQPQPPTQDVNSSSQLMNEEHSRRNRKCPAKGDGVDEQRATITSKQRIQIFTLTTAMLLALLLISALSSTSGSGVDDPSGSIDRFDLGEQIRPPLLRPPTTLAPLSRAAAAAGNNRFTHSSTAPPPTQSAAASQRISAAASDESAADASMTPDEREQLMRSQEAHYGGATSGSSDQPAGEQGGGPEARQATPTLQSESSNNNAEAPDDDSDYGGDGPEPAEGPAPPRATPQKLREGVARPQVPENRRRLGSNKQATAVPMSAQSRNRQQVNSAAAAADEDDDDAGGSGEPSQAGSDDYSAGSQPDQDSYFSRKSAPSGAAQRAAAQQQQLNLAASYNRQQANVQPYQDQADAGGGGGQDSAGVGGGEFGPGPNEAYLAEQAEAGGLARGRPEVGEGKANLLDERDPSHEHDDDDNESASAENDPEAAPPEAMADELQDAGGPQAYAASANNLYTDGSGAGDTGGSGSGDSMTSGDASGDTIDASGSHSGPTKSHVDLRQAATTTGGVGGSWPRVSPEAAATGMRAAEEWHLARLRQNPHLLRANTPTRNFLFQATTSTTSTTTTQAPYNPQLNPSHAGKYFIN